MLAEKVQQVAQIAQDDPDVAYVAANSGTGNRGNINIQLKPAEERPPIDGRHAGLAPQAFGRARESMSSCRIARRSASADSAGERLYQITLQSANTEQLYTSANQLVAKLQTLPGITDATADVQLANPQIKVTD